MTFTCDIDTDASAAVPCSSNSSHTFTGLGGGPHTATVEATNNSGRTGSASVSFTIDPINPVVTIGSPAPSAVIGSSTVNAAFTVVEDNPGSLMCRLDAAPAVACSTDTSHSFSSVPNGPHTLTVTATDLAGRSGAASVSFTVDTAPPALSITSPSDNAFVGTSDPVVTFSATDASTVTYECEVDNGGYTSCASPLQLIGLTDGLHTVNVRATDAVNNQSTDSVTFSVDALTPVVAISSPTEGQVFDSADVDVSFTATDANLDSVTCQLDAAPAAACTSPRSFVGIADGNHSVSVTASDLAGRSATAVVNFSVDTSPPVIDIQSPADGSQVQTDDVEVDFTVSDANDFEVTCDVDSTGFVPCSAPLQLNNLSSGAHSVTIRAEDEFGHFTTATVNFSVDTVVPAVSISAPTAGQYFSSTDVSVSFSATDANLASVTCQLDGAAATACTSPRNFTSLSQGNHTVVVAATDQAGNVGQASVTFRVDTVQPVVNVSFPSEGAHIASTSVGFSFTATDANPLTVECNVDGAGFSTCSSPLNLTSLGQGAHTVVVRATDPVNNSQSVTRNFFVDTVVPAVSISSPTAGQNFGSTSVPVSFSATDANLASVTCQLDAGAASSCTSPRNYTGLSQGDHTVVVAATDLAGNVAQASVTFRVDTIAPVVSISDPTANQYVNSDDVNLSFTATDANPLVVECRLDGGSFAPCASPHALPDLGQGSHTVYVRATDPAANQTTQSVTFNVDTVAPSVSISSPTANQYFNSPVVPVSFSATDTNLATVTCQLDGGAATACTSPRSFSGLGQGDHTVIVRAEDLAGNFSTASVTFRVDSVQPVVNVTFPSAGAHVASTSVAVTFTATDANTLNVECNVDGTGFASCASPLNLTGLSQGAHTVVVRATDPAGNVQSVTRNFIVDTVVPTVAISSPTPGQFFNSTSVTASFTAADNNGVTMTCQLDDSGFHPCSSPLALTALSQGSHTLTARATDPAGNAANASVTFNVDSIQPVVNVSFPTAGAHIASTSVAVAFTATDANALNVECSVDSAAFSACSSPLNLSGLSQGAHSVIVRATDPAGNIHSITRNFTVDTIAPAVSISSPSASQYFNSTSVPVSFSATDANLASVTCQLDGGSPSACTSPRNYASLGQGDHTVIVLGSDQAGNSTQASVTFRVDSIAPVVSISSPTAGQYFKSNSVAANFTATDNNPLAVQCRVDSESYSSCSSPFQMTGLAQGSHTAYVRATDPAGNQTTQSVSFVVDTISPSVTISPIGNAAGYLDSTTVSASFTATDANALTLECRLDTNPYVGCASPASVSGVAQGARSVSVRATDAAGNVTTAVANFVVDSIDPGVAFSAPAAGAHIASLDVDVGFSATDTNALVVECRIDAGGYSPCASQLQLSSLTQGSHTVYVRATDPADNVTVQSRSFTIDTVSPVASITSPDPGEFFGNNKQVVRSFTATDTNLDRVECSLNNGPFAACTSGTQLNLADGAYTTVVRATDVAGNSTTSAPVSFSVDRADPVIEVLSPAANGDFVNTASPSISFTATDGIYEAEDLTVECAVDGGSYADCLPPTAIGPLSEGSHSVAIRVTDLAENVTTSTRSFVVDTIAPAVAITSPSTGSFFAIDDVSKTFTATDLNLETVVCSLDGVGFSSCANSVDYTDLPDGVHTSRVRGTDRAGNVTERSVQFTVDTIAPVVTVTSPNVGEVVGSSDVAISFAGSDATALTYECKSGDGAFAPCGNPFTITGLDDGIHTSTIRATDRAGNTNTGGVQFSVDLTSPNRTEILGVAKPKGKAPLKLTKRSRLIFRDEFNDSSINRRKWSTLRGTLKYPYASSYNIDKEAATYSRNNVAIENGKAVLTLKRKPEGEDPAHPYSSGMLHTGNHFSFKHGYVEARVKVPKCSGCWPAFWMLNAPVDEEWPPEIDIFEYFNTLKDKRPKMNVHWKAGSKNKQWGSKKYGDPKRNYTGGWHTYGLAWNSKRAQVFVDGKPGPIYKTSRNLPKKANYLIFNLALQKGFNPTGERKMAIDYVRVWK